MSKEIWKDVEGYEGRYQVSSFGRVRREGHIVKGCLAANGYLVLNLSMHGKGKTSTIHRIVAKAFIPNPENKAQVNHINGDKTDNRVENLEWVTKSENALHSLYVLHNHHGPVHTRGVRCVESGEIFESAKVAQDRTGILANDINGVARGGTARHTAGGHHWEFLDSKPKKYIPKDRYRPCGRKDAKRVMCLETHEEYPSTHAAARAVGGTQTSISRCCRKVGKTYLGKHWKYI